MAAVAVSVLLLLATALAAATEPLSRLAEPLTVLLGAGALMGVLLAERWEASVQVSAAFVCYMLAIAFLGPVPAVAIALFAELGGWAVRRRPVPFLAANLAGTVAPIVVAAAAFGALGGDAAEGEAIGGRFLGALAAACVLDLLLNWVLISSLGALLDGRRWGRALVLPFELLPTLGLTTVFTVILAATYDEFGAATAVLVVLLVGAFGYMSSLVRTARERTQQYASLSWGVLSGLVRTLDRRDGRTARHSAAVAAFARDIAAEAGMGRREQELAHTAGLLHDIGKFAFADRVLDRGSTLDDADWEDVQRHPELAADLLQDLGVYGPVAEIVRAHHERVDGRGYPDGLVGTEIPVIARVLAVAEVYDTLTAEDTYRTPMTSFEALRELRRVAGTQLDGEYVETLATLLTGRGVEYRHADQADFARELDIERRLARAVAPADDADRSAGGL